MTTPPPLAVGQRTSTTHVVDDALVRAFADVSGDHNPVHLDDAYAATTVFGRRIAHGMIVGSFISAVLANELPGPGTVYLGQTMQFKAPVHIGDEVTVTVEVVENVKRNIWRLSTMASTAAGEVVVGEATVVAP